LQPLTTGNLIQRNIRKFLVKYGRGTGTAWKVAVQRILYLWIVLNVDELWTKSNSCLHT